MEADFTEYYGANLYDLFDLDSKMNVRWVISHLVNLPQDSRIAKHYNNTLFDTKEHLLADVVDILKVVGYYTSVGATSQIDKSDRSAIHKGVPKPAERPKLREEPKEKKQFATANEAREILKGKFL